MKHCCEIIFFPNEVINTINKDKDNERIVNEIIDKFENESDILKKQKLLIYFGSLNKNSLASFRNEDLGRLYIKGTSEYEVFIKRINFEVKQIPNFKTFRYFIYLSSNIRECENNIFKIFTIAHELQHVLQFINVKNIHKKHSDLFRYFCSKELNRFNLPKEHDALKKSKLINYRISDKRKKVDDFINEEINRYNKDTYKSQYWQKVKAIDVDEDYDLAKEVENLWKKYKKNIEK